MKQSKFFQVLFPFIVMAIPWIYLAFIWEDLPQTIGTHFGINGKPDKFGSKNEIFLLPGIMSAVGISMFFVMRNIHKIDPKKKYSSSTSSMLSRLSVVVIVLLCAVTLAILYWTLKGKMQGMPVFFCGLSLFLAYIGNLLHSIKPNYFAGFRVPWALENEDNWRKTHQLASKIWFAGGLLLAVISLLVSAEAVVFIFMGSIFIMTIVPVIYSYNLYRISSNEGRDN